MLQFWGFFAIVSLYHKFQNASKFSLFTSFFLARVYKNPILTSFRQSLFLGLFNPIWSKNYFLLEIL